jgi:dTDP-4-dehydrorhamnose 3,5-epimerase
MKFEPTGIPGVWLIDVEPREDERGFFARTWCAEEAVAHGLNPDCVQCSVSFNKRRGTLRGMHWQTEPCAEAKWIRCIRGVVWDVALDLRPESPAYGKWIGAELSADSRRMIYIPAGVAHGFQTLEDDTELFYQMSELYVPELARGARWNDPAFSIKWPIADPVLSDRDCAYEDVKL